MGRFRLISGVLRCQVVHHRVIILLQRLFRGAFNHFAREFKPGPVAWAVPRPIAAIPLDFATDMGARRVDNMDFPVIVPVRAFPMAIQGYDRTFPFT